MMNRYPIDVNASGAVHLGEAIVCDGFYHEAQARVQTHIHEDHMEDFESSKGFQKIFMSDATRRLLINEKNADLPIRDNLIALEPGIPYEVDGCQLTLLPSGHMLGAVQTCVELPNGSRLGYSGDLSWPCQDVIQVDALVIDSTYGSPDSRREFTQGEVETRLLELVFRLLKRGPVDLIAHRGTLQRALQVLTGQIDCPVVGSSYVKSEVAVYRECGYCIDDILVAGTAQGKAALGNGRYIRLYGKGDRVPTDRGQSSRITLSAFMSRPDDPVLEYSDVAYRVALSDHADFEGTLEYILATGAKYVVTDNTRGGNGVRLALEIQSRLGITARPSSNQASREWGA
jgi:putative mRNA 3-end processing factor